jgi:hypothetical protein
MGPGAGTAMLGRTGLGFANVVSESESESDSDPRPGVGVVAAAGTGAQEVAALLDRGGARVTAIIGVGGRDLSEAVGGRMARSGVRALREDPGTDAVLLVSKPPSEAVAGTVLAEAAGKRAVAALIGLADPIPTPEGVTLASTLDGGATTLLAALGLPPLDLDAGLKAAVTDAVAALPPTNRRSPHSSASPNRSPPPKACGWPPRWKAAPRACWASSVSRPSISTAASRRRSWRRRRRCPINAASSAASSPVARSVTRRW